jgi:hypothetical protein
MARQEEKEGTRRREVPQKTEALGDAGETEDLEELEE